MERYSLEFRDRPVQSLLQRGQSKFVQLSLKPGQGLTAHRAPLALVVIVLSGAIRFTVQDSDEILRAADMLVLDPNVEHAVEALERSIVLLVLVPDTPAQAGNPLSMKLDHENAFQRPELLEQIAPELRPFVEDHLRVCETLESFRQSPTPEAVNHVLSVIGVEIGGHFVAEEQILFPRMAQHVGGMDVGPVARLFEEHRSIRRLHKEAASLFEAWQKNPDTHTWGLVTEKVAELARSLLNHLGKEDSHLFPMASRLFGDEEKAAVAAELAEFTAAHQAHRQA